MSRSIALAVMSRAPSDAAGKTRLVRGLDVSRGRDLRACLLADTLDVGSRVSGAHLTVIYTPRQSEAEFVALALGADLLPQREGHLGERMHGAFLDVFTRGSRGAILIGSDLPTLPVAYLQLAVQTLIDRPGTVVLGPARDGGYYLIGLDHPRPALFEDVVWGGSEVFQHTLAIARRLGLEVACVPGWYDIDTKADLLAVLQESPADAGRHTREWIARAQREGGWIA